MTSASRYSGISTLNHWITALFIVVMMVLGYAAWLATDDAAEQYVMDIHVSLGFFVLLFVLWRVGVRLYEGFPATEGPTPVERKLAWFIHRLLLLVLVVQVITGPLYLFTEGEGVNVFGWFSFYIPLESLSVIHELVEDIHKIIGIYLLPTILVVHFLGAVRHYLGHRQSTPADL